MIQNMSTHEQHYCGIMAQCGCVFVWEGNLHTECVTTWQRLSHRHYWSLLKLQRAQISVTCIHWSHTCNSSVLSTVCSDAEAALKRLQTEGSPDQHQHLPVTGLQISLRPKTFFTPVSEPLSPTSPSVKSHLCSSSGDDIPLDKLFYCPIDLLVMNILP